MPIATAEERIGTVLAGRYTLTAILGEGGMGTVFRGTHRHTGRSVAIKLVRPGLEHTDATKRLRREARASSQLAHPASVEVLDLDVDVDGTVFLVFELLEGCSLREYLETQPSPDRVLSLLLPVLGALGRAHDWVVIHRDLKPDNIFIVEDALGRRIAKLMDFGIAKAEDSLKTTEGAILGTPSYMAPEQFEGSARIGPWTDVWAMGVIFYEALSGRRPFEGKNLSEVAARIMLSPYAPLADIADVGEGVAEAVSLAMQRDVASRTPNMREFARMLIRGAARDGLPLSEEAERLAVPPRVDGSGFDASTETDDIPRPALSTHGPPPQTSRWGYALGAAGLLVGVTLGGASVSLLAPDSDVAVEQAEGQTPPGSEERPRPEGPTEARTVEFAPPPTEGPQEPSPSIAAQRPVLSVSPMEAAAPRPVANRPRAARRAPTASPPPSEMVSPAPMRPAIHREFE